jgi:hypothetical protein
MEKIAMESETPTRLASKSSLPGQAEPSSNLRSEDDKQDVELYGISRIDNPARNIRAWRVSLCRRGKKLVRDFRDNKHGGKHESLRLAKQHRDRLLVEHPPLSRVEFANARRSNNKSGVPGVCLVACKYRLASGAERQLWYWEAIWPTNPGQKVKKRFSLATYGEEGAFKMACEARQSGLQKVKGTFWAAERGEL